MMDGNQNMVARYEYIPFGELIRATGPVAKLNPFRFSTKYQDDETGFLYYLFRYYIPYTGRWIGRDPAGRPEAATIYSVSLVMLQRIIMTLLGYGPNRRNAIPNS